MVVILKSFKGIDDEIRVGLGAAGVMGSGFARRMDNKHGGGVASELDEVKGEDGHRR